MDTLAIDIETYSDVSLPDCGVHRYAASEQFEILLFAYSLNDEPTQIIDLASGEKIPDKIMEYLTDDSVIKTAYTPLSSSASPLSLASSDLSTPRAISADCSSMFVIMPQVSQSKPYFALS